MCKRTHTCIPNSSVLFKIWKRLLNVTGHETPLQGKEFQIAESRNTVRNARDATEQVAYDKATDQKHFRHETLFGTDSHPPPHIEGKTRTSRSQFRPTSPNITSTPYKHAATMYACFDWTSFIFTAVLSSSYRGRFRHYREYRFETTGLQWQSNDLKWSAWSKTFSD